MTGVQTCALPICKAPEALAEAAETVIDGAETTAEDIVNGTGK